MKIGREVIKISLVIVASFLVQLFLHYKTPSLDDHKHVFHRAFTGNQPQLIKTIDNRSQIGQFSGYSNGIFYFAGKKPGIILGYDSLLNFISSDTIQHLYTQTFTSNYDLVVDSSEIKFSNGKGRIYYTYDLQTKKLIDSLQTTFAFSRAVKISPTSYVFRYFDNSGTKDQYFLKQTNSSGPQIIKENNISEKKGDGGISTDGMLLYNSKNNFLLYTHFYSGLILRIDTNLNLQARLNTIDSITENKTQAAEGKDLTITNVTPRYYNSYYSTSTNDHLYVASAVISTDENQKSFVDNSTIDVYGLPGMNYVHSFHLPKLNNKRLSTFKIIDEYLIAVYPSGIALFSYKKD